jgi:hypothetical protein
VRARGKEKKKCDTKDKGRERNNIETELGRNTERKKENKREKEEKREG